MIPTPMQKAIGKLGMLDVLAFGFVTLSATKSKLKVRIASMNIPFQGSRPSPGRRAPNVALCFSGVKLRKQNDKMLI